MDKFKINWDKFEEHISHGYASLDAKVHGFWGRDTVRLIVNRNYNGQWSVSVGSSSGGRDTSEVADDLGAYENKAIATLELVRIGRELPIRYPEFERLYQARLAEMDAYRKRREAEAKAAFDADSEVGEFVGLQVLDVLKRRVQADGTAKLLIRPRGQQEFGSYVIGKRTTNGAVRFRDATQDEVLAKIAKAGEVKFAEARP